MYKQKRIAIVFFARSNSKRLKSKLFKKIKQTSILSINFKLLQNIKYVDEKIVATTTMQEDDKIVEIAKKHNIKVFRGSEKNVLERFYLACKELKNYPDIVVRYCCENPLSSVELIELNIKKIINQNLDLISVLKPSNLIFGIAPIIMNTKTLNLIFSQAKNEIYKEHVENFCFDNPKLFKISYPISKKKFFFPDTSFSIDTLDDYNRVKNIFKKLNLKFKNYNYLDIIKSFSFFKIFVNDPKLLDFCKQNLSKEFKFINNHNCADFIFDCYNQIKKFKNDKVYLKFENLNQKIIFYCIKNNHRFNLLIMKKYSNLEQSDYLKLFFSVIIKKVTFWPPIEADDLTLKSKKIKLKKNNWHDKFFDYFPNFIISNSNIDVKENICKIHVFNDEKFLNMIKNKEFINTKLFVYNNYFVYYKNRIVKIKKFNFYLIPHIWRSYQYSTLNNENEDR